MARNVEKITSPHQKKSEIKKEIPQFQQKMIVSNSLTRTQFPDSLYIIYDSREVTKKRKKLNKDLGHHRQQIHPAKTKLSSRFFAELGFKGKGGSQEGKWVSKKMERAAVLWCIALSLSGWAYWIDVTPLNFSGFGAGVRERAREGGK